MTGATPMATAQGQKWDERGRRLSFIARTDIRPSTTYRVTRTPSPIRGAMEGGAEWRHPGMMFSNSRVARIVPTSCGD